MTIEQEVISLVAEKTGRAEDSITPERTFYQLGIDGDDAIELVEELCTRYEVPAKEIDLNKYIGPDGGGVFNHILSAFGHKDKNVNQQRKELRISDLIKTAKDRRWFDVPE
jgi:acyl carrier protein